MSIKGNFDRIRRVEGIDPSQNFDDNKDSRKRRKVNYQGRTWEEGDEELPLQPQAPEAERKKEINYLDPYILEKAEKLALSYTTLEDKIAALFFFETEAYYDPKHQKDIENLIQKYKIGGFLFTKGEYKRQTYLIQRYQELAQVPLLFGNDFTHGLSYYFQEDAPEKWGFDMMSAKFFSDLGKAVYAQNRNLGVHFQFTETRNEHGLPFVLTKECLKAFRKGIRDARGIISFFGNEDKKFSTLFLEKTPIMPLFAKGEITEIFSLRTMTFFDLTSLSIEECQEKLLSIFQNSTYDSFLFNLSQQNLISFIAESVKKGKISEKEIDKRLMKILAINIKSSESQKRITYG